MSVHRDDFVRELTSILNAAAEIGAFSIDVHAGDLHRRVVGYPSVNHKMPTCCSVMREAATVSGDKVMIAPPKGNGANRVIRFVFPRG